MDLNEVACIERKREYDSYAVFHFPSKLSRRWHPERQQSSGISQGEAQGYLVTETMLDSSELEPKILYTDILSPRLTRYFPSIQGIVSEN